jgi:hypothetical protein
MQAAHWRAGGRPGARLSWRSRKSVLMYELPCGSAASTRRLTRPTHPGTMLSASAARFALKLM